LVDASGRAVKGVAIGVMGTAFIAGIAAWIGFTNCWYSIAAGLAAITFFVVIQIGPLLVILPVIIWLECKVKRDGYIYDNLWHRCVNGY
jgi:predicted PurR-regulated permease PerM